MEMKRKFQAKKVVCIPAPAPANSRSSDEIVPSDLWAWRKSGQKPIKGSPYPRRYYRCSSSKGCWARKQVERSRLDPNMVVVTYTAEHNHPWPTQRNAIAGSTKKKVDSAPSIISGLQLHSWDIAGEENLEKPNHNHNHNHNHNATEWESMDSLQGIVPSASEHPNPDVVYKLQDLLTELQMDDEQQSLKFAEECIVSSSSTSDSDSNRRNREERIIEQHIDAASDSKGKRKTGPHLDLEALKPHFGKKLNDVAKELGVGRSTIKRACRDYGIDRWPTKAYLKMNPSLFQIQSGSNSQPETITDHVIVEDEAEKVMIKVQHEEDIIKFEFCISLGMSKLVEKVATCLKLEVETFKLKYMDEDDDEILLTSVDDLKLCHKSQITMGRSCIKLFVR